MASAIAPKKTTDSHSKPNLINPIKVETDTVNVFYGENQALKNISIAISGNEVTACIGPSGCGKSTFLRCLNRMNDTIEGCRVTGHIIIDGQNINHPSVDVVQLRTQVGMVFQKPNPFPKSIFNNVAWGPLINGYKGDIHGLVERSLQQAALWEEVKDRLKSSAMTLSGGQQQRLCIARTLAMEPEVVLMDEPCSALDPVSTAHIEDLMFELKKDYTLIIVTHNMQQASRVSKYTAFFEAGHLIEFGETHNIFTRPKEKRTEDYVTGRFG